MKRIIALLMALSMMFCLCACNKDDEDAEPVTKEGSSTSGLDFSYLDGTYLKQYAELIANGNYIFTIYDSDGSVYTTYTRVNGDEKIYLEGVYLIKTKADGKIYVYSEADKTIMELTSEVVSQSSKAETLVNQMNELLSLYGQLPTEILHFVKYDAVKDEVVPGVAYHEEYKSSGQNRIFSFGFDENGTLIEYAIINSTDPVDNKISIEEVSPNEISYIFEVATEIDGAEQLASASTTTN